MAKFIYFRYDHKVKYPIGNFFSSYTYSYITEMANYINKTIPTGRLILVVRGHSGSILAGGVAYILVKKKRAVSISISRKEEEFSHGENLEGISLEAILDNTHIIVIDDFIETGKTILTILEDLIKRVGKIKIFDMLCISNHWDNLNIIKEGEDLNWRVNKRITSHFKYILCNDPKFI